VVSSRLASRVLAGLAVVGLAALFAVAAQPAAAQSQADELLSACRDNPANPYLVTSIYPQGRPGAGEAGLLAFRDSADNSGHITLATARQVGATWGLGYDERRETLYMAAVHKRGVPFGPGGPGAIYALNLADRTVRRFVTVPDSGRDTHNSTGDYFPDQAARYGAGTTSLGDLDINPDGTELAVMNLYRRRIYRYSLPDGKALGDFPFGAALAGWQADGRPFGLGYHNGKLYHGVVRTAFASQDPDELWAFVYESNPDGSAMREVASTGLRYARGFLWPGEGEAIWNPWKEPPGTIVPNRGRYPMPMLSDIEFAPDGHQMIVGFRDRFGDMTFYTTPPNRPPPGEEIYNTPGGDIVAAWPAGDTWRFQTSPEFYTGDFGPNARGTHDETSFGGIAVLPGQDTVVMSANSPIVISSAGAVWLSISAGSDKGREELYRFGQGDNFGKANGLGDVEVLCSPAKSETATPVATDTPTARATDTPSPTDTPTLPATDTPTATPTATVRLTPTPTRTATITFTPSPGPSPTPSNTPRVSATPTRVPSATATVVVATAPPSTPGQSKERHEATPAPGVTPIMPLKLPSTGGGPRGTLVPWLALLALVGAGALVWRARRRVT
jgi:hypothetical protein